MIAMFTVGPGVLERISKYMSCDIDRLINTGIKVEYHAGDFQDSVILCKSGVRWFPGSRGITFYDRLYIEEPPKDKVGCIKNVGVKPMKITFVTDKEIILQPGELYKAE